MSDVTRYDFDPDNDEYTMYKSDNGEFVRHEDYADLTEQLAALKADKKRLQYFEAHALNFLSLESGKEMRNKMRDYDEALPQERSDGN